MSSRQSSRQLSRSTLGSYPTRSSNWRSTYTGSKASSKRSHKGKGKKGKIRGRYGMGINALMPTSQFVNLVYESGGGLSSGVTQDNFGTAIEFYLNSIYGPRVVTPNFNVQGYDQLAYFYSRYKVYNCLVEIIFSNPSQDGLWAGVRGQKHGNADDLSGEALGTSSMKRWTRTIPINNTGDQWVAYRNKWDIAAMEGLTKFQMKADNNLYAAEFATQPTNKPYLQLALLNSQDTTNASIMYRIKLTMFCHLFDRKPLPSSVY